MDKSLIAIRSPVAAKILKETRRVKGITLKDLSEKTGLSEGYLSLLERTERPMNKKNFFKIFKLGFQYEYELLDKLWKQIIEGQNDQGNIANKTIASSKYRVRSLGFSVFNDPVDEVSIWYITCRWTLSGRIYIWQFNENNINHLRQKNPLTSEENSANWQQIYQILGKLETLSLLEAISSEVIKLRDDVENERQKEVLDYALPEIEDVRDALESVPPAETEIKPEDLPF